MNRSRNSMMGLAVVFLATVAPLWAEGPSDEQEAPPPVTERVQSTGVPELRAEEWRQLRLGKMLRHPRQGSSSGS